VGEGVQHSVQVAEEKGGGGGWPRQASDASAGSGPELIGVGRTDTCPFRQGKEGLTCGPGAIVP
jgi:hypothetical protein